MNNRRNRFLRRKREIFFSTSLILRLERSVSSFKFFLFHFGYSGILSIMADPQEVIWMTRMLEVEELSFCLQLEDVVRKLHKFSILFSPSAMTLQPS